MSEDEFDATARATATAARGDSIQRRIPAACRGSGNPAALAWLAEGLGLEEGARVVDIGAGLGGSAAWFVQRYGSCVVCAEPAAGAVSGAAELFALPIVRADAHALPFPPGSFVAATVLGVVSVVADGEAVLREARAVAGRLGVLEWCSTGRRPVLAGGSTFPTPDGLERMLGRSGWDVVQADDLDIAPPERWRDAADDVAAVADAVQEKMLAGGPDPQAARTGSAAADEREVEEAISERRLRTRLVVARAAR